MLEEARLTGLAEMGGALEQTSDYLSTFVLPPRRRTALINDPNRTLSKRGFSLRSFMQKAKQAVIRVVSTVIDIVLNAVAAVKERVKQIVQSMNDIMEQAKTKFNGVVQSVISFLFPERRNRSDTAEINNLSDGNSSGKRHSLSIGWFNDNPDPPDPFEISVDELVDLYADEILSPYAECFELGDCTTALIGKLNDIVKNHFGRVPRQKANDLRYLLSMYQLMEIELEIPDMLPLYNLNDLEEVLRSKCEGVDDPEQCRQDILNNKFEDFRNSFSETYPTSYSRKELEQYPQGIFSLFGGGKVNEKEAEWLDTLDVEEQMEFRDIHDIAYAEEQRIFETESPQYNGLSDSFRHVYWTAMLTQTFGYRFTVGFTTARELNTDTEAAHFMDLHNNALGIRIAIENPDASPQELADLALQAICNGEAVYMQIPRTNFVEFTQDPFATGKDPN